MGMDLIARATAVSAKNYASLALARNTTLDVFTNLPGRSIDPATTALTCSGYSAAASGGGTYVADATANAALAAAHPRFCKADSAGRYFRLSGDFITVEQGGATGVAGTNDQPAIQAAVNYAAAVGIREVHFTQRAYELWCPIRTTTTGPGGATDTDGYPILITEAVTLVGMGGISTLTFKNSVGGDNSTITQTTAWGQWIGGGIWVNANKPGATADIPFIRLENLTLAGTSTYTPGVGTNPPLNAGRNISDKGMGFVSNGSLGVNRLILRNVTAFNFSGGIFYGGCFKANSAIIAENVELYNSNQSAWNATGTGKVFAINLNAHDAYLPSENILGQGHTYVNCRFANGYNAGCIGTQFFTTSYHYAYPNRDTTKEPTWCTYINTTFENIPNVTISSWARGSITAIDCSIQNPNWNDQDIYLDITIIQDQFPTSRNSISIGGPATLTTQYTGCPAGVYLTPPKNITLNVNVRRTAYAVSMNGYSDTMLYGGLVDKASVRVTLTGETRNAISPYVGSRPAGYGQPLTVVDPTIGLMFGAQPFGGSNSAPSAAVAYDVNWSAMSFAPTGGGSYPVTINTTYTYVDGQLVTFFYKSGSGTMTFAPTGAGMKLAAPRALAVAGDKLVLRWSSQAAAWMEETFVSARPLKYVGNAAYDAPSIAAGASVTTTVTVTGAALGDFVTGISLGLSASGLMLTGYVSAANTVTVAIANLTGAAVDLAATTLSVEVTRK